MTAEGPFFGPGAEARRDLDPATTVLLLSATGGRQGGFTWSLEGQADAAELLDLARETAARARVEKPGDRI